jgi:gliding motility-associated-like protein
MNKIKFTLICTILFFKSNYAQFWEQSVGGDNVDEIMDVCEDVNGNIISVGYFCNTGRFSQSYSLISASSGISDIFICKSNASGIIQWAIKAGGNGSDRALSVATDNSGNIFVTGFYFGTANFGNISLTSINGSKDVFIAKISPTGNFLWATSCGGNLADIGNSIAVDVSGSVIIAGQFEGTANFGTSTFSSMINPNTNLPSIDIFLTKYDNNGNFLWAKNGTAEFTDRALDVITDNNNNIYMCGQFSDTITFNTTYNNPIMNAVFLIKYDASGSEIWFKKASGSYSIAYGLAINNNQEILMTGDYQGTLAFYGNPNVYINDTYSKRIFTVKYSNTGSYIWSASESSNNYISSRNIALDGNGNVYIAGEFGCTLNKFADVFGQGTFNSVGHQDLFVVKYNTAGTRQWMRNMGGPRNDKLHGLTVPIQDKPIIAGSFEDNISFPMSGFILNNTPYNNQNYLGQGINSSYCNDNFYGVFGGMSASGYSDGFMAFAIDLSRQPYDYYYRTGNNCTRDFIGGCIEELVNYTCPDTVTFCGSGSVFANTHTGRTGSVAPYYKYLWHTSPNDTLPSLTVNNTGYYSVKMTTIDGCYTSEDTVFIEVNPVPAAPTISDDYVVNTQAPPTAAPVIFCAPDTILLYAGNLGTNSFSWHYASANGPLVTTNDSFYTDSAGTYFIVVTNQFGCRSQNFVNILTDTLLPTIVPITNMPDSFTVCQGASIFFQIYDSLSGQSAFSAFIHNWTSNPALNISSPAGSLNAIITPQSSGMYHFQNTIILYNTCGADTFYFADSAYISINPNPSIQLNLTGNTLLCPGDSTILYLSYTPSTTINTVITVSPADSIIVTQPSYNCFSVSIRDTVTGCQNGSTICDSVNFKSQPVISTVPFNALICPNDSVQLICNTAGVNYQWIGPNGILPYNTQIIYDSVPGFYHCIVTDINGCVLTSNTVELKQYNTPYLVAQPSNIVCLGQTATLQVITNDTTLIQWNAPLSGSGTQQTVNQTGTYSCSVTMCGITTICSLTVIVSQAVAIISGPTSICPNDSAMLTANQGMYSYNWSVVNGFNDSTYVYNAGQYILTTTDINGCTTSDTITLSLNTSTLPPGINDTTICAGDSAIITAWSNLPVNWYDNTNTNSLLYTGNTFVTPVLFVQDTFYVAAIDTNACNSVRVPVIVLINPTSLPPQINADTLLCQGDTIQFFANSIQGANYSWYGPNNFSSSAQNPFIVNADTIHSGTYTLVVSGNGCSSPPVSININVSHPLTPILSGTDTVCQNDMLYIQINNYNSNASYVWTDPNGFSFVANGIFVLSASLSNSGTYSVYEIINGCVSSISYFTVVVLPAPAPPVATSNSPICVGDTLLLFSSASGSVSYTWSDGSSFISNQQNLVIPNYDTVVYSNVYHVNVTDSANGCPSGAATIFIVQNPLPIINLGADTTICLSSPIWLQPQGNYSSYLWHDSTLTSSYLADSTALYWLTVTDNNGCRATDSIFVTVDHNCRVIAPNIFTPNGDGINDFFSFIGNNFKAANCKIYNRWGGIVYEWNDANGYWDGTNMNTKEKSSTGTYYFKAIVLNAENIEFELKGFVYLSE